MIKVPRRRKDQAHETSLEALEQEIQQIHITYHSISSQVYQILDILIQHWNALC